MTANLTHGMAACRRYGVALVTVDPGTTTGWCVRLGSDLSHGESAGAAAASVDVLHQLRGQPIGLLVIERPFGGLAGRSARIGLPWAAGEVRGRLAFHQLDEDALWTPMASQWRKVLGLAKGKRAVVNDSIHTLAESTVGQPLRTETGHPQFDRANAICMMLAATKLFSNEGNK